MADVRTPGADAHDCEPRHRRLTAAAQVCSRPPRTHARSFFTLHMLPAAASSCHTLAALRLHHALAHVASCVQVVDGIREVRIRSGGVKRSKRALPISAVQVLALRPSACGHAPRARRVDSDAMLANRVCERLHGLCITLPRLVSAHCTDRPRRLHGPCARAIGLLPQRRALM